jgi:hypothetical protein
MMLGNAARSSLRSRGRWRTRHPTAFERPPRSVPLGGGRSPALGTGRADVSGLEPTEEVRDPRGREVGAGIADHEPAAGSQDPGHLTNCQNWVRIMVEGVRTEHSRELPVAERKLLRVGDLEPHVLDAVREVYDLPNHLRGEVGADDGLRGGRRP